ncbi:MAG: thioredoxin domain-containing protein [Acidimicrobiia bacterium]
MTNHLASSASPYLLQHKDNPVDWHQWGDEAFSRARDADRPVLLSIGYSTCHWCHVMAHESFEDEATASYMNEHFINIKVDREERPDVDRIYMDAVQAMTGRGGWPMTVFLTPTAEPFYAGTYFPKTPRGQMPSFRQILEAVVAAWDTRRDELVDQAAKLTKAIGTGVPAGPAPAVDVAVDRAVATLTETYDAEWGGFGGAPKFPQAPVLGLLVKLVALEPHRFGRLESMLRRTLDAMRAGGIFDQLGGGFARYSVDGQWLIPHFEKMLYDNALLASVYLNAGRVLSEPEYVATARATLDYMATTMRDREGGIHAAEDADSEGVEGKYYVWSWDEVRTLSGDDTDLACELYGVTRDGNFEGANNLHVAVPVSELAARRGVDRETIARAKDRIDTVLRAARARRVRPGRDDKVVAAWNGLALRAFAEAAAVLDDPGYREVAIGIAHFIETDLVDTDGRLLRSWRAGRTSGKAFCVDYGSVAVGLFTLYQATADERWYRLAERLTGDMVALFGDGDEGFFSTVSDGSGLIARPRDFMDNPLPSANSMAAEAVSTLAAYRGEPTDHLERIATGAGRILAQAPHAVAHLLGILYTEQLGRRQVAIVGPAVARTGLERVFWERYRPDCVLALGPGESAAIPLLQGRDTAGATAAGHVCRGFTCDLPVTTAADFRRQLGE